MQFRGQRAKLLRGSHCVDLHAPVRQIARVAAAAQIRGVPPREIPESDALHHSGNVEPFGVNLHWHGWRGVRCRKRAIVSDPAGARLGKLVPLGLRSLSVRCSVRFTADRSPRRRPRAESPRFFPFRGFAIFIALILLFFATRASAAAQKAPPAPDSSGARIVLDQGRPELQVDGKPFFVYGAAFDYFGLPRDLWAHSLDRYKELGINTIDLTIPWNWHETAAGEFDFDGHSNPRRDLRGLLRLIADRGFKLVVHAGPQTSAAWRLAGYPDWLVSAPAYGLAPEELADGAEPRIAAEFHSDADAAAAEWLGHEDFLRASQEWLLALGKELAPYCSHVKISIASPDTWGESEAQDVSGPLLFVLMGDGDGFTRASTSAQDPAALNLARYLNTLCAQLAAGGVDAPCLAAPRDLADAALGSLGASEESGPVHATLAGLTGQWYFSPTAAPTGGDSTGATLDAEDAATLELLAETLEEQSSVPALITGFHAGGYPAPGEISPPKVAASATALGSRLLLARGIGGITYAPLQDSLAPAGYETPGNNRYLNRDVALSLEGASRTEAAAVERNGQLVKAWGERLASAHVWANFGVVDLRADFRGVIGREEARRALEQVLRVADLAGVTADVVDPETQPVERLLNDRVLLLIAPNAANGAVEVLPERARKALLEYVLRGGRLVAESSAATLPELAELWDGPGTVLRTEHGADAILRAHGDGATIEWKQDFYSWVDPNERLADSRAHPEADWAAKGLARLITIAGAPVTIVRSVGATPTNANVAGNDELVFSELVGSESNGSIETLGARCLTRPLCAAGLLSATNLDTLHAAAADLTVSAPPESGFGEYQGTLPLHVAIPAGDSLLLPLHAPLCNAALPGETCKDEIITSGAEVLDVVREGKTLELTLYAPETAKIELRLDSKPEKAELDENGVEGQWIGQAHVFEVSVLRGAAPDYLRVLKIYLKYAPLVEEKAVAPKHPASAFEVAVLNAVRLPLGQGPSLASVPPLIVVPSDEVKESNGAKDDADDKPDKGERLVLRTSNRGAGAVGFEARVHGPLTGTDSVHVDPGGTYFSDIKIAPDAQGAAAWPGDGRIMGKLTLDAGKKQLELPLAFQRVGPGGTLHYTFDFERDGAQEWVLENEALRLFLSPRDGGRLLALVSLQSGENFITTVGGLRDWFLVGDDPEPRDFTFNRTYSAEWTGTEPVPPEAAPAPADAQGGGTSGGVAGVRMRYGVPEAGPAGATIEKTVRLLAPATVEARYRVSLEPQAGILAGDARLQFVAAFSLPAASGEDRGTQFCWITSEAHSSVAAPPSSADTCYRFVALGPALAAPAGVSHLQMRTPGHATLDFEWTSGSLTLAMKSDSVLLEVAVPLAPGLPAETALRYTVAPGL